MWGRQGWRDSSAIKSTGCFSENPGSIPSTDIRIHNHLKLQFQGIPHLLLTSRGTAHMCIHAPIHIKINNYFVLITISGYRCIRVRQHMLCACEVLSPISST